MHYNINQKKRKISADIFLQTLEKQTAFWYNPSVEYILGDDKVPATESILRYPGGKSQLYAAVKALVEFNSFRNRTYVEPFAGGAGLALKLLYNNVVPNIVINDFDPAIYAVWYACLNEPNELKQLINTTPLTINEWDRQKAIYLTPNEHSLLELGFATLYLNRTNKSGIIEGGVLGKRDQSGPYKMSARFNRDTLCKKISRIASHRDNILLFNLDAKKFLSDLDNIIGTPTFLNIDPPYVKKGAALYHNFFREKDHRELSHIISLCSCPWIVTYDMCDFVHELYEGYRCSKIDVHYSANIKRNANEYMFFSNELRLSPDIVLL